MKEKNTSIVPLFFLIVIFAASCAGTSPQIDNDTDLNLHLSSFSGQKKVVAVIDLRNTSEFEDSRIGRGISKMLITAFVNSGRFRLVERNNEVVKNILQEQKLGISGMIDPNTAAKVGKMLGAEAVIVGEVSEFGIRKFGSYIGIGGTKTITTRIVIDARMINTETAEIIAAQTGIGTSSTKTSGIALSFEFGTEGFDETTIGIATRKAVNMVVKKFADYVDANKN